MLAQLGWEGVCLPSWDGKGRGAAQLGCTGTVDVCPTGMYREWGCLPRWDVHRGDCLPRWDVQESGDVCPFGMYREWGCFPNWDVQERGDVSPNGLYRKGGGGLPNWYVQCRADKTDTELFSMPVSHDGCITDEDKGYLRGGAGGEPIDFIKGDKYTSHVLLQNLQLPWDLLCGQPREPHRSNKLCVCTKGPAIQSGFPTRREYRAECEPALLSGQTRDPCCSNDS